MTDWLDELDKIRRDDEEEQAKNKKEENEFGLNLSILKRRQQAVNALKVCNAHSLLRHVNSVLLRGKGDVDFFDRSSEYDHAMALFWKGPISKAQRPKQDELQNYFYILVAAKGSKVYVNHRPLESAIPETLKKALVWAAKNPLKHTGD